MFKKFGLLVIIGLVIGIVVSVIYGAIVAIVGCSSMREFLSPIGGEDVVLGGISGFIAGSVGFWFLQKKTDYFS